MSQSHRLTGGQINRHKILNFTFNKQRFEGHPGDTLASALLANGQRLIGRSFKYHRPRGIFSAGSEEPNALVELRTGAYREPNTRATVVELFAGLNATSQNHHGPLAFDVMAVNDALSPLLSAGFYYKTFMWPKMFWEKLYEPVIRAAAGLGKLSMQPDPDQYDKGFLHTDLLIIGAGPAGLMAALTAARSGARVLLADEDFQLGGRLNAETYTINDGLGSLWAKQSIAELASFNNVRIMSRTTVYGAFDHGIYGAVERCTDHLALNRGKPRQILWRIYSRRAILCSGSTERSIAFGNNDRPGIMLAGAVRSYVNRWGVAPGKRVAVFTNNDDGWRTAADLMANNVQISAVIDSREGIAPLAIADAITVMGGGIASTAGRLGLHSIRLTNGQTVSADCLAVSGGWNPNVQLSCHQRGRPKWKEDLCAFVPGDILPAGMLVAGAANGEMSLFGALKSGQRNANDALDQINQPSPSSTLPSAVDEPGSITAFWHVKQSIGRAWIDLQNDVTTKDIAVANQEGFHAAEHLKRYTTLGMATDQGKTAGVLGLAILAKLRGISIAESGTTVFRPPYTPIPIATLAGRARGENFRPTRHTPSHQWAEKQGAVFSQNGLWLRAQWFGRAGETSWQQSVNREVMQTRQSVGLCDVTTLGKIDIQGLDAALFIDRVYANNFLSLAIGKVRYGLMLREDGFVMDDGTTARLAEHHYIMTTTTANAVSVFRHLEFCRQCLWPNLDVHLISATEQWAQYAVAGPNSRRLLEKIVDAPFDLSNKAFPFMACAQLSICGGTPARLFRISFSGELAFEIAVAGRYGDALINTLMAAGEEFAAVPYGTEALGVMRIEKGHPAGNELNGQTTALNLGMGRLVSKKKDCIGSILSERPGLVREAGIRLVGFKPVNHEQKLRAGAHFISTGKAVVTENDQGWMSSVAYSPTLGHSIGLGFIIRGDDRIGEVVQSADPLHDEQIPVEIVSPHFVDPQGERLRG